MGTLKSYYAIIEPGTRRFLGVWFPDLPGCVSVVPNWDQVATRAEEVLGLHLAGLFLDGDRIPVPSPRSEIMKVRSQHPGCEIERITVDLDREVEEARERRGKVERINITVQSRELERVDELSQRLGLSRSAYFRRSALELPAVIGALHSLLAEHAPERIAAGRDRSRRPKKRKASREGSSNGSDREVLRRFLETFGPLLEEGVASEQ